MNCFEIEEFVHQAVDNELSPAQAQAFQNHINSCEKCMQLWQRVLNYKKQVKEVAELIPAPSSNLNDKLISTIRTEGRRERRNKIFTITSMAAALLFFVVAVAYLNPQVRPTNTVASINLDMVTDHYHNHASMDKKKLMATKSRMAKKTMVDLVAMSEQVGFPVKEKQLEQFMLASSEVLRVDETGRKVVRLCYKTPDLMSSTCIDCYQTEKGAFKVASLERSTLAGKEVRIGKVNGNSVIYFQGANSDLVFVSVLPQEKLMKMIASRAENLS